MGETRFTYFRQFEDTNQGDVIRDIWKWYWDTVGVVPIKALKTY